MVIQEVTLVNNQVKVCLQGSIYVEESVEIMRKFIHLIEEGYISFLVDFSEVDYIDSAGIGILTAINNRVRKRDGGLVLKGLKGLALDMFKICMQKEETEGLRSHAWPLRGAGVISRKDKPFAVREDYMM